MTTTLARQRNPKAVASNTDVGTSLHGHSFDTHLLVVTLVEAIGTFVLVLVIAGAAVAATLAKPIAGTPYGSLTIALAGGIALAVLVASFGPISGAHFNPAVTFGLAVTRKFPWARVPGYVVGQFAGAISAALIVWWSTDPRREAWRTSARHIPLRA
jgi:glycerol uptake facilitator-like aquaporin